MQTCVFSIVVGKLVLIIKHFAQIADCSRRACKQLQQEENDNEFRNKKTCKTTLTSEAISAQTTKLPEMSRIFSGF